MRSNLNSSKSAFGETQVTQSQQILSYSSSYNNLNNQCLKFYNSAGGTQSSSNGLMSIGIGTTNGDFSIIQSKRTLNYNPGVGNMLRLTCMFNAPVANSTQICGLGDYFNGFYFGYNGVNFGILRKYGGKPEIRTLTITTGFTTGSVNITITLNSVAYTVASIVSTGNTSFTASIIVRSLKSSSSFMNNGWSVESIGSIIYFISYQDGAKGGSYSVNFSTSGGAATGGIVMAQAGVSATNSWTTQTNFKYDTLNGSGPTKMLIDPSKLNVYQIQMQYLGAGKIIFGIEDFDSSNTGFSSIHMIDYPNQYNVPSINNPNMKVTYGIFSNGSTTAMSMGFVSFGAFTESISVMRTEPKFTINNLKASISTENSILVIKNKLIYNNIFNTSEIKLLGLGISSDGTKNVTVRLILNPTCGNTSTDYLNYLNIDNTNSLIAYDVTNKTFTGGLVISAYSLGKTDHDNLDVSAQNIILTPGDELYVTGTSTANSDIQIFLSWIESQ